MFVSSLFLLNCADCSDIPRARPNGQLRMKLGCHPRESRASVEGLGRLVNSSRKKNFFCNQASAVLSGFYLWLQGRVSACDCQIGYRVENLEIGEANVNLESEEETG
mgnify:CR=1 FL=1